MVLLQRYRVTSLLSDSGGMGLVYLARDQKLNVDVVVKVPRAQLLAQEGFVRRFESEIKKLCLVQHPHITRIVDFGTYEEVPFFVLEYLGGGSLGDRIQARWRRDDLPSVAEQLHWLRPIASTLDHLHASDPPIVHRDVKPANILFHDKENVAVLSDFGVAKVVGSSGTTTRVAGSGLSPAYAAPEQCRGLPVDGRTDQYALAGTVFHALTNKIPFDLPRDVDAVTAALTKLTRPPHSLRDFRPDLSEETERVLNRALSKQVRKRYKTCSTFVRELAASAQRQRAAAAVRAKPRKSKTRTVRPKPVRPTPVPTPEPKPPPRQRSQPPRQRSQPPRDPQPEKRRSRTTTWLWSLAVLTALAGGAFAWIKLHEQRRPTPDTEQATTPKPTNPASKVPNEPTPEPASPSAEAPERPKTPKAVPTVGLYQHAQATLSLRADGTAVRRALAKGRIARHAGTWRAVSDAIELTLDGARSWLSRDGRDLKARTTNAHWRRLSEAPAPRSLTASFKTLPGHVQRTLLGVVAVPNAPTDMQVFVNGVAAKRTAQTFAFSLSLSREGKHTIEAVAWHPEVDVAPIRNTVVVDRTPPRLTITAPQGDQQTTADEFTIRGNCSDANGVSLTMGGRSVPVRAGTFAYRARKLGASWKRFRFEAKDRAGNKSTASVKLRRDDWKSTHTKPKANLIAPRNGATLKALQVTVKATLRYLREGDEVRIGDRVVARITEDTREKRIEIPHVLDGVGKHELVLEVRRKAKTTAKDAVQVQVEDPEPVGPWHFNVDKAFAEAVHNAKDVLVLMTAPDW